MIIGLLGKARSGKDTVGGIIKRKVRAETLGLADPIKVIAMRIFDFSYEQCFGKLKEVPDERYPRECKDCAGTGWVWRNVDCETCDGTGTVYLTPRMAMQHIGTEVARSLYKDVWIDYGIRRSKAVLSGELVKASSEPDKYAPGHFSNVGIDVVAITDVRFINEAKKIRKAGGMVWRIVRDDKPQELNSKAQTHASEMEMDSPKMEKYVNLTVLNNGSLEDLEDTVGSLLFHEGVFNAEN